MTKFGKSCIKNYFSRNPGFILELLTGDIIFSGSIDCNSLDEISLTNPASLYSVYQSPTMDFNAELITASANEATTSQTLLHFTNTSTEKSWRRNTTRC